jgi:hypothetical protein
MEDTQLAVFRGNGPLAISSGRWHGKAFNRRGQWIGGCSSFFDVAASLFANRNDSIPAGAVNVSANGECLVRRVVQVGKQNLFPVRGQGRYTSHSLDNGRAQVPAKP